LNGLWLTSSAASAPDPAACTLFLLAAFSLAGVAQSAWLRSKVSNYFTAPLDGGATFRGRRVFGDNKTWKGLVVMVPAVGIAFWALAAGMELLRPESLDNLWPLAPLGYFVLGCWAGLGFMLGELPNSFVKRQADILPGTQPQTAALRAASFVVDRTDSVLGALIALALVVEVPWLAWVGILLAGPLIHWLFNVLLVLLGVKAKAA
jgi:CDP-2,3-bis-(O-geranylgeranyl)-sn-glycerol synthase